MTGYSEYIQLLQEMVKIPSPSFEEEKVRDFLCQSLTSFGVDYKVISGNILSLGRCFSPEKKTLALIAHIDTVPPSQDYTVNPYDPGTDDSVICGLGSNDDGGSVAAMIAAFRHFYDTPLPFNLMLVLSCEEECAGADGSRYLFGNDFPLKGDKAPFPYPSWAIVGEPTGMKAATSERGLLVLDGEATGVSGHAARNNGINALYIAIEDIQKLRAHSFERVSPIMGKVNLNVTQINSGTAHNVIPDKCSFVVDIRPTEMYSNEEILEELQALCKSRLNARRLDNRSSATAASSPLLKTIEKLNIETFSSPTTSDWMQLRGCDAIKMGPGQSERSHKANEYLLTKELKEAIDTYISFIRNFNGDTLE